MIILDVGSGRSLPDKKTVRKMINALKLVDSKNHEVVIKAQLFKSAPPNAPLDHDVFTYLFEYGAKHGYNVTASVFDKESLDFLKTFDPVFIKIACVETLYPMVRNISKAVVSYSSSAAIGQSDRVTPLCCVRAYPATIRAYEKAFSRKWLKTGISDHTVGMKLYNKYKPDVYECHYVLEHDDFNPDAGLFAKTPSELEAIL